MTIEQAKNKWISWLRSQLGYHEVGDNITKYATDSDFDIRLYGFDMSGQAWCDYFADFSYMQNFGFELGMRMTYQFVGCSGAACRYSAEYYRNNGAWYDYPEVGDQAFFYYSGAINHTECVIAVQTDGNGNWTGFTTIGGNSSDMVRQNQYSRGASVIAGFGRPNWGLVGNAETAGEATAAEEKKADEQTSSGTGTADIKADDLVSITDDAVWYNGGSIPSWVLIRNWYVLSVYGDRAVLNRSEDGGYTIMSPINTRFLTVVKAGESANAVPEAVQEDTRDGIYTVKSGDTLWAIAKTVLGNPLRYKEIKALNGLTSDLIHIGQVLKIPE